MGRDEWIEAMAARHGLLCRFDPSCAGASTKTTARAGKIGISNVEFAWQSFSPIRRHAANDNGEYVLLEIVTSGRLSIELRGQGMTFGPGDMVVVDPAARYNSSFREPTRMSILSLPKSALRERGLRDHLPIAYAPDPASPDVAVVRNYVLNLTAQAGTPAASTALLARLGEQCLDLMDVLVVDGPSPRQSRAATTALRVRQVIARQIGNPDLSVERIAAELNMSTRSLTRALQVQGLSAMRHVWAMRLEHAARLLADAPPGGIQTIAYRCGFANPAHFSRAFRQRYGITPREYAANLKAVRGAARPCGSAHAETS
jgi:AraC-like DNA-binding protein